MRNKILAFVLAAILLGYCALADRLASKPWVQDRLADLALAVGAVRAEDAKRALALQQAVERLDGLAQDFMSKVAAAEAAYLATQSALLRLSESLSSLPPEQQEALVAELEPAISNLAEEVEIAITTQNQLTQQRMETTLQEHSSQIASSLRTAVSMTQFRNVDTSAPARDREVRWISTFNDIPPTTNTDPFLCEQRLFVMTNAAPVAWPAHWTRANGYVTDAPAVLQAGTNLIVHTGLGAGCKLIQARNLGDL